MKNKSGSKIYNSNLFWLIVSLLISVLIWVLVASQETDSYKVTFRGVHVDLAGANLLRENKNMVVTDLSTNTVTITVTGPRRVVASLSSDDLSAMIDVSKLSQAAFASMTYSVNFPNGTDTSKLTVTSKIPETISFTVSALNSKSIPVRGSFNGSTASGCTAEEVVFEPSTIEVSGPDAYLKNISYAWVTFEKENVSSTYSEDCGFVLMDENGEPADTTNISCSTDIVKATLPILELKEVPLDVQLEYDAGANQENTKVTIEPASITLAGDSAILAGLNKIVLTSIDLSSFESTFTDTYPIAIENSLNNVEGVTEAKVTVEITGLETKSFRVTNIQAANVTEGFTADILTKNLDVKLRGTAEQLNALKNENIRAVADLTDYEITTGNCTVPVKIYVDGATDVGPIGDYTISLEILKDE